MCPASPADQGSQVLIPAHLELPESLVRVAFLAVLASLARQEWERVGLVADRAIRVRQERRDSVELLEFPVRRERQVLAGQQDFLARLAFLVQPDFPARLEHRANLARQVFLGRQDYRDSLAQRDCQEPQGYQVLRDCRARQEQQEALPEQEHRARYQSGLQPRR